LKIELWENDMQVKIVLIVLMISFSFSMAQPVAPNTAGIFQGSQVDTVQKKSGSRTKSVLYSLILPGAGQWSLGYKGRAKFFMGAEVLLWVGYFGTQSYANVIQDNYQSYAAVHAGTNSMNKAEQYWIDIGSSDNIYAFNEQRLRDRNKDALYSENPTNYWQWDNRESRKYYNNLRVQEHDWERRATFIVGAFILNRVVSAIDVIRLIRKEKKQTENQMSRLNFNYKTTKTGAGMFNLRFTMKW
jgi:hypothetical protein